MVRAPHVLPDRRIWRSEHISTTERSTAKAGHRSRDARQLLLLPCDLARLLRPGYRTIERCRTYDGGKQSLAACDRGEALWTRPRISASPQPATPEGCRRKAD